MNNVDASRGDPEAFADLRSLIAVIADPKAAQAQADAFQAQRAELAEQRAALTAGRDALEAEKVKALGEMAELRAKAERLLERAYEQKRVAEAREERVKAYAAKVGYWEPPTIEEVGPGGLTRAVPERVRASEAKAERPRRPSREDFPAHTTLTREVERP